MTELSSERLHATCVAIGEAAVLIVGRSGSGKSDLAVRLIDRGAVLVSDDSTHVERRNDHLVASAPDTIKGKIELFGVGILDLPTRQEVKVKLIVSLDEPPTRMPDWGNCQQVAGIDIPVVGLAGREASTAIKVEHALRKVTS
jgi:serine kinase of HPr protein (carbohydrate metabolism regulator)